MRTIISYEPLWKTLQEKGISQYYLLQNGLDNKTLDKQIEKQRRKQTLLFEQLTNFDCFLNSFGDAQKLLRNLKDKLNDVHLMAQRIEEVEKEIDYDEQI